MPEILIVDAPIPDKMRQLVRFHLSSVPQLISVLQIYNDSSPYRSGIKTIARSTVKALYNLFPAIDKDSPPMTGEQVRQYVRQRVQELLSNMSFLNGTPDDKVRLSPIQRPILMLFHRETSLILHTPPSAPSASTVSILAPTNLVSVSLSDSMK
jgi:hypothetical protein